MSNPRFFHPKKLGAFCLVLALPLATLHAADDATPAAPATSAASTAPTAAAPSPEQAPASNEALRAFLQLQLQLHDTQLAIERDQQQAQAAAALESLTLSNHMQAIEQSLVQQRADLVQQRADELADTRHINHLLLVFIALFALGGFGAALFTALYQWRALSRLAEISAALPALRGLGGIGATAALGSGEHEVLASSAATQSNSRLLDLVGHLEKRIAELEHAAVRPLKELPSGNGETSHPIQPIPIQPVADAPLDEKTAQVRSLLERGQALLNDDHPEDAIAIFDKALALSPEHAETLVKKGAALEKLRQPQEALECYDRAINADHSMTIAYLHKGGLCNRLERYSEAMECYEQALHTQERKRAAA